MVAELFVPFAFAVALSYGVTPWVMKIAARLGALDQPNERKTHSMPTLRLGGLAVIFAFFLALVFTHLLYPEIFMYVGADPRQGKTIVISCLFIVMLGITDDLHPLTPWNKFIVQALVSTVLYAGGVRISSISNPLGGASLDLGVFGYPVTVLWIVGVTNALNLIDGLDGLASGVAAISALTICAVSSVRGEVGTAIMAIALVGAIIGFLPYNFYPAKVFLGDSGSLFLGFVLAILSMLSSTKGSAAFALSVAMLALGLPIVDTCLAIVRRVLRPFLVLHSGRETMWGNLRLVFQPDRDHIHHRLMTLGLSHRDATLLLYAISGALGCAAFAQSMLNHFAAMIVMTVACTAAFVGLWRLHYHEMALFENGLVLSVFNHLPLRKGWLQGIIDVFFMAGGYIVSMVAVKGFHFLLEERASILPVMSIVAGVQVLVYALTGSYRGEGRFYGPESHSRMVLSVFLAVVSSACAAWFVGGLTLYDHFPVFLLDFFLLVSFTLVTGLAYRTLYLMSVSRQRKKLVLIYGAGDSGKTSLERIMRSRSKDAVPLGFIDEDESMRGGVAHGYPVHGTIEDIPKVLKKYHVDEIVVPAECVTTPVLGRLAKAVNGSQTTIQKLDEIAAKMSTTHS